MHYILLANGFEEIEAISVIDILRRAQIDLKSVSITDSLEVKSDRNLIVKADIKINEIDYTTLESIILPGGSGHKNLDGSDKVKALIKKCHEDKKNIFAICAAPSILGKMNILKGIQATCYPGFEKHLKGAIVKNVPVVTDGHIITSKGPGTAHLFAYAIVDKIQGSETASQLKEGMLFE